MEPSKLTREELAREMVETKGKMADSNDKIDSLLDQIREEQKSYRKLSAHLHEVTERYWS